MNTERLSGAAWVARLGDEQELTAPEKTALIDFLRESPTHVREVIEHALLREDLRALALSRQQIDEWVAQACTGDASAIVPITRPGSVRNDLEEGGTSTTSRRKLARTGSSRAYRVAAVVFGVLLLGGALLFVNASAGVYTTGFGEARILTLPDGSVVTLNTESRIRIRFSGDARRIELSSGEAFFQVAREAQRPFVVTARDSVVRAIGTQFNVRIAREDTLVTVVDGAVRVSVGSASESADRSPQVTLSKGEAAKVSRREAALNPGVPLITRNEAVSAALAASWTHGRLEFDGTPLVQVLAEFQRYRQFQVEFDGERTRQLALTGSFEAHDPESVLAYIGTIPDLVVEQTGPKSYFIHHR